MELSSFPVQQQCMTAFFWLLFQLGHEARSSGETWESGRMSHCPALHQSVSAVGSTDATGVASSFSPQSSPYMWALEPILYTPRT